VKRVAILTPWFPNRPGDYAGAFIADSALAVKRVGWQVSTLVVRPWLPSWCQWFAHEMVRGDVCPATFPLTVLKTIRVPAVPRSIFRPVTDLVADKIIGDAITQVAHETSADVIHVQTEGLAHVGVRVAREQRLPVVVTLHGINAGFLDSPYQKRRLRPALEAADRVILVGEPLREYFRTYIGSDRNFDVVPNGIDLPLVRCNGSILANDVVRLVSIANLHEGKGVDLTLLALARLQSEGISNWTYRVIGDGRERSALLKLTSDLELTEKVSFIGAVRHAEIFSQLARDDVFVLPSYREAFGIAYLEAMAVGLLTIGVMGEGPSQFIRNRENGVLVPPRDVEALVVALRNILIGDHNRWREIALEGQRMVQDFYTWDNHAKQLVEVYEHVIRGGQINQRPGREILPALRGKENVAAATLKPARNERGRL